MRQGDGEGNAVGEGNAEDDAFLDVRGRDRRTDAFTEGIAEAWIAAGEAELACFDCRASVYVQQRAIKGKLDVMAGKDDAGEGGADQGVEGLVVVDGFGHG